MPVAAGLGTQYETIFQTIHGEKATLSNKTILEHHRLISTILAQAEKEMLVPYNAAEKATPPTVAKKEPNYFQPEQIAAVLEALETEPLKWQCIVNLLIVTGCRRGEIMGLHWSKISFDMSRIKIDRALLYTKSRGVYEDTTKTSDTRYLTIPVETLSLLWRWKGEQEAQRAEFGTAWQGTSDFVFTRPDGQCMNPDSITAWLSDFSDRHNLPHINPHAFRHTVASVLIANGTDVVTVSKQLGHANVGTTENFYAHIIAEQQARASDCLANVLLRHNQQEKSA